MLTKSDVDTKPVVDLFSSLGVEFALLVPTVTAMKKSIIDATRGFRSFLEITDLHFYGKQLQGPDNKVLLPLKMFSGNYEVDKMASLYRPVTKNGDPRIWFYGLKAIANHNNLLAMIKYNDGIALFNCSSRKTWDGLIDPDSDIRNFIRATKEKQNEIKQELLFKLKDIAKLGFVKAVGHGPKAVGETLESLLGIAANSSKKPDYKGIEIKSGNASKSGNTTKLKTIISMAPDWKRSNVSNAVDLLSSHAYMSDGRLSLAFTMHSQQPNTKNWQLTVDIEGDILWAGKPVESDAEILFWDMQKLMDRMRVKHRMTAWVSAKKKVENGATYFKYEKVTFTDNPPISQVPYRLADGTLKVDLTMHLKENGKARDHGYLFRVQEKDHHLMFPQPEVISLM
ncbi:MvaI/BcnI family restriction endonuclease [Kordiimonas sp. SCSIO 12610]|uniref:MvaI/BcnI family restriction endonuclease n=1 Tax=Kordiimonas sp. SCSIO 12610 TaxID=2829597 RepID=UPI00210AEF7A|nr:MvaI/BcnI family restriction endonuclease [Kordiimonas sp. SCSIO 12610]UTW54619.1 hypothetical protein KFF44_12515 [Kordiimonas sp. SCSIO 12610]